MDRRIDADERLAALFEERCERSRRSPAVRQGPREMTYAELRDAAASLADRVRQLDGSHHGSVAVMTGRSLDTIVALWALIQLRRAFVAVDPSWPVERIQSIVNDSGATMVIAPVDSRIVMALEPLGFEASRGRIAGGLQLAGRSGRGETGGGALAITYTSGSTGAPKGVMTGAEAVLARLEWMSETYDCQPGRDVVLVHRPPTVIGYIRDVLSGVLSGMTTVAATDAEAQDPGALVRIGRDAGVTHLSAAPTLWRVIIDWLEARGAQWPTLRIGRSGGEALQPDIIARWRSAFPNAELWNIYGSTECSGALAARVVCRGDGRPDDAASTVSGVSAYVLDRTLHRVPDGSPGDLYLGGASLALGYVNAAGLTAETFIADPHAAGGSRMLRTGDLAVRRSDGRVDIVGRGGDRLKIRGFRVEPAEVEAVLRRMPNVADVAVGAVGDEPAVRLVAYVVVNAGEAWNANEAWAWSQAHLPSFMQPAEFVPVPAMPMTAGAKLDRRALAALSVDRAVGSSRASSSPESSATESTLRTIVQEVLQIDDVASGENFFALGGNSILGIQVLARVYDVWQLDLSPTALFDAPTVAELADVVDTALKERERTRASVVAGR